jgi:archaellum biogenesis protein FlaJ (TadC family)
MRTQSWWDRLPVGMERVPVRGRPSNAQIIAIILLIAAIVLVVIGVIYFTVPADKLPSFMGRVANVTVHRSRRGTAAITLGIIVLIASIVAFLRARERTS